MRHFADTLHSIYTKYFYMIHSKTDTNQAMFSLLASIEYLPDEDNLVKITPLISNGCSGGHNLTLHKDSIGRIESTDQSFSCCGKILMVKKIYIKADTTIPVKEALNQLVDAIKVEHQLTQWKRHIKMSAKMLSPF